MKLITDEIIDVFRSKCIVKIAVGKEFFFVLRIEFVPFVHKYQFEGRKRAFNIE